jgi:MFS family permease
MVANCFWSQAYMFYQLKSFDQSLPDSTIATQAGMMASSFTGAQFLTAMLWGRVSDSEKGGRKLVLLIGLFGTSKDIRMIYGC